MYCTLPLTTFVDKLRPSIVSTDVLCAVLEVAHKESMPEVLISKYIGTKLSISALLTIVCQQTDLIP